MKVKLEIISQEIIDQYDLKLLVEDSWIYVEIKKGMYGLPQAGLLANKKLTNNLAKYVYHPNKYTPSLW